MVKMKIEICLVILIYLCLIINVILLVYFLFCVRKEDSEIIFDICFLLLIYFELLLYYFLIFYEYLYVVDS